LLICVGWASPALADGPSPDPDPWFGPDKALHFGVAFGLSTAGYGIGVAAFDERWAGLLLGGGVTLGLAAAKEGFDAAGLGTPSGKDFLWGVVGTALGLGVSITFDAALRGTEGI
jgi:putative lipoprotein